jgi:hypothetical protein
MESPAEKLRLEHICLCNTPAFLLCPEHEQDGEELRAGAYLSLAMMFKHAHQLAALRLKDTERLNFLQSCELRWSDTAVRVSIAYPSDMSLREGIDSAMGEDEQEE